MPTVTLHGTPFAISGDLPTTGSSIADFNLANGDLEPCNLESFKGNTIVFNIFPSIDTPVCAVAAKKFNEKAAGLDNVKVLCVSKDLPFALKRFCGAEGVENVIPLSAFRDDSFGKNLGVQISEGPLAGLFARAVVVTDDSGKILHSELVPEIADEPNYEAALSALAS